jgi:hypothetical protein
MKNTANSPMEILINKQMGNFKCTVCKTKMSVGCNCWEDCKCGWKKETGKKCDNPKCNF